MFVIIPKDDAEAEDDAAVQFQGAIKRAGHHLRIARNSSSTSSSSTTATGTGTGIISASSSFSSLLIDSAAAAREDYGGEGRPTLKRVAAV